MLWSTGDGGSGGGGSGGNTAFLISLWCSVRCSRSLQVTPPIPVPTGGLKTELRVHISVSYTLRYP